MPEKGAGGGVGGEEQWLPGAMRLCSSVQRAPSGGSGPQTPQVGKASRKITVVKYAISGPQSGYHEEL